MVLSLAILALSFSNASLLSNSHLNLVSLGVFSRNGAVRKEYLGMNVGKYPVMPRELLTASFDSGGLAYLTALILPGFGFNPPSVNWWSVKLNSSTPNWHLSGLKVMLLIRQLPGSCCALRDFFHLEGFHHAG